MNLSDLSKPLSVEQIEFRVQSVNKKRDGSHGAILLAYKDARVDMQRLDEVCGPLNWKREHSRDNANCIVSIWNEDTQQWVGKEDTGTQSNTEAEKGLASDSFKRACFNWGIGRELYDFPFIWIDLHDSEVYQNRAGKTAANLRPKDWTWYLESGEDGRPTRLAGKDKSGTKRFDWQA